ncbi:MAG: hypothetical protein EPN21_18430 [Methylococcaceae bacterium]|nr:MAG: hypothetical protein EPN21_18430 [Methylococcaceae bacterium]
MAKCRLCNLRQEKRKCHLVQGMICSLCCGQKRNKVECEGCVFYKEADPRKKYSGIPRYTPQEMDGDFGLQDYSNAIEGSLCAFDSETGNKMKDESAIKILELLLDKYHFKEETTEFSDNFIEQGFAQVKATIDMDLRHVPEEEIVKILSAIRFVADRRAQGGRDYLAIIHKYVGKRVAAGVRILSHDFFG